MFKFTFTNRFQARFMKKYTVIGMMSGTSLDGVDIALCEFTDDEHWNYSILEAETIAYSEKWKDRLANVENASALELSKTNVELGQLFGEMVKKFVATQKVNIDFLASHGHTIFHQPSHSLTVQIGSGAHISAAVQAPVICDFRTMDVAMGGQGAPLVPIGDQLLFADFDYCLNLGGIANVSYQGGEKRFAYDICPANMALNILAAQLGFDYDKNGELARSGKIIPELLDQLNSLDFYQKKAPKSLGKEWFTQEFQPLLNRPGNSTQDLLRTATEHVAQCISNALKDQTSGKILTTGGGAYNQFLIELLQKKTQHEVVLPTPKLIDFKEAMIFAFLGVLRWKNEPNCLHTVTGAEASNIGGAIYQF
jgi:anhydro-N-acetylmuramic acid kinase